MSVLAERPRSIERARARLDAARVDAATLVFAVVLFVLFAEAVMFVVFGYLNRDEGWYLLSGKLVYDGKLPYRDFPYFQGPILPYVFGVPQQLFGSTLLVGRLAAATLAAGTLALVVYMARAMGGRWAAIGALALLAITPEFMIASVAARSEAIILPLMLLSVALAMKPRPGFAGFLAAPLVLLIATAIRITFLPALLGMLAYSYVMTRPSRRECCAALSVLAGVSLAIALPFVAASPHRAWFDVWTAQVSRGGQFQAEAQPLGTMLLNRVWFLNLPAASFFVVVVPALLILAYIADSYRTGWRPRSPGIGGDRLTNYAALIAFALVMWAPYAVFDHQEPRYFVPSFVLLSIVVADALVHVARRGLDERLRLLPPVVAALGIATLLFGIPPTIKLVDVRHPDVRATNNAADVIESLLAPHEQFVTFDPALAVAAQREVVPGFEMGQFSYWPKLGQEDADRNGVANLDVMQRVMLAPATKLIAIEDYDLDLISDTKQDDDDATSLPEGVERPFEVFPYLYGQFEVVREFGNFGQFRGTLYILERVAPAGGTPSSAMIGSAGANS